MGNIKYDLQNMPAGEECGDMPSAPRTFDILFFSLSQNGDDDSDDHGNYDDLHVMIKRVFFCHKK